MCVPVRTWGNCYLLSGVRSPSLHGFTSPLYAANNKEILGTAFYMSRLSFRVKRLILAKN